MKKFFLIGLIALSLISCKGRDVRTAELHNIAKNNSTDFTVIQDTSKDFERDDLYMTTTFYFDFKKYNVNGLEIGIIARSHTDIKSLEKVESKKQNIELSKIYTYHEINFLEFDRDIYNPNNSIKLTSVINRGLDSFVFISYIQNKKEEKIFKDFVVKCDSQFK